MRLKEKITAILLLIFLITVYMNPHGEANKDEKDTNIHVLYVGGAGSNNYTKIQDAINIANSGETIYVYNDSSPYYENIVISKPVSLVGEDRNTTIINGTVRVNSNFVYISEFTMTCGDPNGSAVRVSSSSNTISNCNILNSGTGIYFDSSSYNIISNCNVSWNNWQGIFFYKSSNNTVINCVVIGNRCDGIEAEFLSDFNNIVECVLSLNGGDGFGVHMCSHNIVSNCNFLSNGVGISDSSHVAITYCNMSGCGIVISYSSECTLTSNQIQNTDEGLRVTGNQKHHYNQSIGTSTTVNGKPVYYYYNLSDSLIEDLDAGHITLAYCVNVFLRNITISDGDPLYILYGHGNVISNAKLLGNRYGIWTEWSSYNIFLECNISGSDQDGIFFYHSAENMISNSSIINNYLGIDMIESNNTVIVCSNISLNKDYGVGLYHSYSNTISNCIVWSNDCEGIDFYFSSNNSIINTRILSNDYGGILVYDESCNNIITRSVLMNNGGRGSYPGLSIERASNNNIIYHNNFINNSGYNAYDTCTNYWDYNCEGNYWDDYTGYDDNKDEIGDVPYNISWGNNKDNYPFLTLLEFIPLPEVLLTYPLNDQIDVLINTTLLIVFSEPMWNRSIEGNIIVFPQVPIRSYNWNEDNTTLTLVLSSNLKSYTEYTVIVNPNIKNLARNNLAFAYQFSFRTKNIMPPEIILVQVVPSLQVQNGWINVTCTVTGNVAVNIVKVNISGHAGFTPLNITMTRIPGTNNYYYNSTYSVVGIYSYYIWASDTSNNGNKSTGYQFTIMILEAPPTVINWPLYTGITVIVVVLAVSFVIVRRRKKKE